MEKVSWELKVIFQPGSVSAYIWGSGVNGELAGGIEVAWARFPDLLNFF